MARVSPYIEQYQKCHTAADVESTQERIMKELERGWIEDRKAKGQFFVSYLHATLNL